MIYLGVESVRNTALTITHDWSTAYPGWTAQEAGILDGLFADVPEVPAIVNGRYAPTNIMTTTNHFYRLRK